MTREELTEELSALRDEGYRRLQLRTVPTLPPGSVIGVRTPDLRRIARRMLKVGAPDGFLRALPHPTFEENQLHAFMIAGMGDFGECVRELEVFLPYVDNWATCDQMSPRAFEKHRDVLRERAEAWIESGRTYTVRFGIRMLMDHFLDGGEFDPSCLGLVAAVRSEEYYVRMMAAWYFATALAKQYGAALPYIEGRALDPWTHDMAIRKSVESLRIPQEKKEYLRSLRIGRAGAGKGADRA